MTGSADERALLAGICAAPDDDVPRLVYADWLDENGDPARAEFIRLQCALARLGFDPGRRRAYYKRVWALLQRYQSRWRAALPDIRPATWGAFARGMVDSVSVDVGANWYPPDGPETGITPLQTLVCRLDGGATRTAVRAVLDWGVSGAFDVLVFQFERTGSAMAGVGDALVRELVAFPWGDRPRLLDFSRVWLAAAELSQLAAWPRGRRTPAVRMRSTTRYGDDGPIDFRDALEARFGDRIEFMPERDLYL